MMKVIKKVVKEGFIPEEDREFLDKEHEENIKRFEDAIKDNKKTAEETIPKEGETGKKIKSKALKAMHLEESLFTEDVYEDYAVKDLARKIANDLEELLNYTAEDEAVREYLSEDDFRCMGETLDICHELAAF